MMGAPTSAMCGETLGMTTTEAEPLPEEPRLNSACYNFLREKPTALEVVRTEGCYLYTPNGDAILDAAGGAIVVNIGHGRREVADAYSRAVAETSYVVPPFATGARVRLVERLVGHWLPSGLTRVAFASGGSEAMDFAIRLACQHHLSAGRPRRWRVIGRELSYHGTTLATLAVGGHKKRRQGFEPWLVDHLSEQPRAPAHYCLRCPLGKSYPECEVACADAIEEIFRQVDPETVAAFVLEPIVGSNAGALVPPDEYLPRVAEICRRHGVLLIADEVMTGFGRTGTRFGVDHWSVTPDILVSGKGLTGGYAPLAAICSTEEVMAPIAEAGDEVMFYTYGAHSACCAVGDKVLEILEREELVERAATMGKLLRERLEELEEHPNIGQIRGRGLLYGIELVADRETMEPFAAEAHLINKAMMAGLEAGVFFYPGGNDPARDVLCLGPPFILGEPEIDHIVTALRTAIDGAVSRVRS